MILGMRSHWPTLDVARLLTESPGVLWVFAAFWEKKRPPLGRLPQRDIRGDAVPSRSLLHNPASRTLQPSRPRGETTAPHESWAVLLCGHLVTMSRPWGSHRGRREPKTRRGVVSTLQGRITHCPRGHRQLVWRTLCNRAEELAAPGWSCNALVWCAAGRPGHEPGDVARRHCRAEPLLKRQREQWFRCKFGADSGLERSVNHCFI